MTGRPSIYADETVAQMRMRWDAGESNQAIAERFGISRGAMSRLAERRGFARRDGKYWKPEEDAILRDGFAAGKSCIEVAALLPDRSATSVKHRRKALGIPLSGADLAYSRGGALAMNTLIACAGKWERNKSNPQPPQTVHTVFQRDLHCESVAYTPEHRGCRWMISGARPWTVCAGKRLSGESYCVHHAMRSLRYPFGLAA